MNRRQFIRSSLLLAGSTASGCRGPADPAPDPPVDQTTQPLRVGVYGDSHAGYDGSTTSPPSGPIHEQIVGRLIEFNPNLVFNLGDHIHNTGSNQWEQFASITSGLRTCCRYYPTVGNHDTGDGGIDAYVKFFASALPNGRTYYHIRHPLALFAVLDVHESPVVAVEEQQQWLEQVLADHDNAPFKIVIFHIPPWTTGGRGPFPYARAFNSICRDKNADLVLNGHIHAYERFDMNGINYIVSGGAGGFGCDGSGRGAHCLDSNADTQSLRPFRLAAAQVNNYLTMEISETACAVTARDLNGTAFDTLTLTPRQASSPRV